MKSILIDAGPLIALFDKSDSYHAQSVEFLKRYTGHYLLHGQLLQKHRTC